MVVGEIGSELEIAASTLSHHLENQPFDFVITVCDHAREACPVFSGAVKHRLHIGFDDPAEARGSEEEVLAVFRRVRDDIRKRLDQFHSQHFKARN